MDDDGSPRSLEVWFANGSLTQGVQKPAGSGLIKAPKLDLTVIFKDYMYIGYSGTSGPFLDTHELQSWNFETSYPADIPAPTPIPRFFNSTLIAYAVCGTILAVVIIYLLGYYLRKQRPDPDKYESGLGLEHLMGLRRFTFKELKKAMNNCHDSALLGKGRFGSVYKGTLTQLAFSGLALESLSCLLIR